MFKISICDDEKAICEQLELILERIRNEFIKDLEWDVFYSGESLYKHLSMDNYYDLIFLDIELKEMNGVEVGQIIRNIMLNESTHIVYISGKETYAMELFKVRPLDFIIKPFDYEDIKNVLNTSFKIINRVNPSFKYKIDNTTNTALIRDILYFESRNRKIIIHQRDGTAEFYGKLKDIHQELEKHRFIQIHKSYLVNYNHITKLKYDQITLSNGKILPISQTNRVKIRRQNLEYERV